MDHSSTSTSEEHPSDGVARKPPAQLGLIGIAVSERARDDRRPLQTAMPRHRTWLRYLKFALLGVVPVGVAYAAHVASEPEGLDMPEVRSSGARVMEVAPAAAPAVSAVPRRVFETGAFGHSGAVRVRIALPNQAVALPMRLVGQTDGLTARWVGFDGRPDDAIVTWPADGILVAPARAGAYWLVLSRSGVSDTVADFAMFVERPMPNARATGINGYHLGRWPKGADAIVPRGFVEVTERIADFPLSPHLRMSDFVVHDDQDAFPKYLHVREPLLDKLELTITEIAQMRGRNGSTLTLHVASGFRSPAHNGSLSASAKDSRHMYGDAADIAIDANDDGKLTEIDARLVAAAAEVVERKYPDLVGGIGLYINADGAGWPYVHIDTRGRRARWRGGPKRDIDVDSFPTAAVVAASAPPAAPATDTSAAMRRAAGAAPAVVTPAAVTPAAPPPSAAGPTSTATVIVPGAQHSTATVPAPGAQHAAATVPAQTTTATVIVPTAAVTAPSKPKPSATATPVAPVPAPRTEDRSRPTAESPVRPVSNTRVAPDRSRIDVATPRPAPTRSAARKPTGSAVKPAARPSRRAVRKPAKPRSPVAAARRSPAEVVSDDPFASAARRFRAARP